MIIMPILAIIYFLLFVYSKLRYGPDHIPWFALIFVIVYIGIAVASKTIDNFMVVLPIFFIPSLSGVVAFGIQRKQAGNLILTYKRNVGKIIMAGIVVVFVLLMSYLISIPNVRKYSGGEPVYDERYYRERLPTSIVIGLIGLAYIPAIFRKGEFFENGIATPDLQFFSWSGYQSYDWIENTNKKDGERFSLFLKGGRNYSFTIHGFSENATTILDDLLSTKLVKIPKPQN